MAHIPWWLSKRKSCITQFFSMEYHCCSIFKSKEVNKWINAQERLAFHPNTSHAILKKNLNATFSDMFVTFSPSCPSRTPSHSHVAVLQIRMVRSCDPVTLKPIRRHGMITVNVNCITVTTKFLDDRTLYSPSPESVYVFTKLLCSKKRVR